MSVTRRQVVGAFGGVGLAALAPPASAEPQALIVNTVPIERFVPRRPEQRQFGALTFRGGLVLTSPSGEFGGWSGLAREDGTGRILALSDTAQWLQAMPIYRDGRLAGLAEPVTAPLIGASGRPLGDSNFYDTEGLSVVDGTAYVCFERVHAVLAFPIGRDGLSARGRALAVPAAARRLPTNRSFEAIGVAPRGSALAGAVVVIAERARPEDEPTLGFILGGPQAGTFSVARPGGYDVTDLAFLENGDMLILERRASWLGGIGMRIRRIDAGDIRQDATLRGTVLIEADLEAEIDNMEGMSVHRDAGGRRVLSLISDNNFAFYQRTLLLEFWLD